jgi:endonuclease YncB( thermonuclease family)
MNGGLTALMSRYLVIIALIFGTTALAAPASSDAPAPTTGRIVSAYDGDTMTLESGERIRLRWVNTPELRPKEDYGIEAREAAKALVTGKTAKLIFGPVKRDSYGRLIAGVEVDGVDLSTTLLEQGLGHLFLIPPDDTDHTARRAAQTRARAAGRGIWSTDRYKGLLHITSFHANAPGDDRGNVNGEYLRICNVSDRPVDLDGFRVTEQSGRSWMLPPILIPPGHTFKLHSGKGEHQTDASAQLAVYLGSDTPIWNNTRDRVTLYDRHGRVIDSRLHATADKH